MSEFLNRIRLIPREQSFLDRITGSTGQIYTNRDTGSLRIYNGKTAGGAELARNDFDNIQKTASLDLQSQKNRIRFHWDTLADLESEVDPVVYHGMIAHVHSEGRLYFAHAAEWVPVANLSELAEAGTSIPYTPDEDNNLQWVEGEWDFGQNIIKYANAIQTEAELDNYSPVTYHGMTMHVHATGALYYAHSGAWRKLITDTSYNDAVDAGYVDPLGTAAYSNDYADLDNAPASILDFEITDGANGEVLQTDGNGNFSFVAVSGVGSSDSFSTIVTDDGETTASSSTDTLEILGGTNISTFLTTGTKTLDINLEPFSINFLTDVDTQSNPPQNGQVLKWDGSKWAPGEDIAETGGDDGGDAQTLNGFAGSYYLDYNNFTNTPDVVTLTDLSIGNTLTASGLGAISYDNTTGVFRYTPPTAEGIGALTSVAFSDLTSTPTTISGYGITDAFSGSFGDLSDKPTTLSGYGITDAFSGDYEDLANKPTIPQNLLDLNINDGSSGQVLTTDGAGNFSFATVSQEGGDGDPDQNLWATITADSGSTTADTTTDTLTVAGGTDIATSISGDTLTVSFTGSAGGASNFDELADVSNAGIDVNDIFEAATVTLRVNNEGSSAYTFNSHYSGSNPTIFALSGTTIAFDLSQIGGHPFEIRDPGGSAINSGLVHVSTTGTVSTGANAQGFDSGTLYWRIQESLSGNFSYICQFHGSMAGTITVKRLSTL